MNDARSLALIGIALPFGLFVLAEFIGERFTGSDPLIVLLASFLVALGLYLPWIIEAFKQYGTAAVCVVTFAALLVHLLLAAVFFAILFFIGGDTI